MLKSTTAKIAFTIMLITLVGFVLPMLAAKTSVDHGLYVAAAAGIFGASALRRDRLDFFQLLDRLVDLDLLEPEVLDHSGRMIDELHAAAVEAGRLPEMWRALPLWTERDAEQIRRGLIVERDETVEDEGVPQQHPIIRVATEKACTCGHSADVHGELFGCWSVRETGGLECKCSQYSPGPDTAEPDTAGSDEATITNLAAADVTARLHLTLDRIAGDGRPAEYELTFDGNGNFPTIDPDEIPALIDALTVLYRQWRDLAAEEGTL